MLSLNRFLVLCSLCAALCGAEDPPTGTDEALRARVSKFFQAHVDGKFRVADEVVAEDSKDAFFAADKSRYDAYEILKIEYSENFTKAKAVVACKTKWSFQGHRVPVTAPFTSLWKLEKDQWFWYTVTADVIDTPFGKMKSGPDSGAGAPGLLPGDPRNLAQGILAQVKVDKKQIDLQADKAGQETIVVSNTMPGPVSLSIDCPPFPGLSLTLEKATLAAGEKTLLHVVYAPAGRLSDQPIVASLEVSPTHARIPLRIQFQLPKLRP